LHWLDSGLHKREGKAITNFQITLPSPQSDLAHQTLKDPYCFDFLTLRDKHDEQELESGLLDHVQRFLLELGAGFSLVGRQVHLEVGGQDFYIDLLFYHYKLRCFIVVELKATDFKPEFVGKINFYLSAVDDKMRHPDDKSTIGLLLCKGKNKVVAEYALRDINKPIGISQYEAKIIESLPDELKGSLPSIEQIEQELEDRER
jgi:predicted nuclease of restriction endonuclease-like (RecB) superfamily